MTNDVWTSDNCDYQLRHRHEGDKARIELYGDARTFLGGAVLDEPALARSLECEETLLLPPDEYGPPQLADMKGEANA
jgi:hypothetical protein